MFILWPLFLETIIELVFVSTGRALSLEPTQKHISGSGLGGRLSTSIPFLHSCYSFHHNHKIMKLNLISSSAYVPSTHTTFISPTHQNHITVPIIHTNLFYRNQSWYKTWDIILSSSEFLYQVLIHEILWCWDDSLDICLYTSVPLIVNYLFL